jgi:hypothetical protein
MTPHSLTACATCSRFVVCLFCLRTPSEPKKSKGGLSVSALADSPNDEDEDPYADEPALDTELIASASTPSKEEKKSGSNKKKAKKAKTSLLLAPPEEDTPKTEDSSNAADESWMDDF